jgi:hypothetical protein
MSETTKYRPRDLARDLEIIARAASRVRYGMQGKNDAEVVANRALYELADSVEAALSLIWCSEIHDANELLSGALERARRVAPKRKARLCTCGRPARPGAPCDACSEADARAVVARNRSEIKAEAAGAQVEGRGSA